MVPDSQAVIELQGIGKTYVSGAVQTPVLFDISFRILPGEFVAIVGGSGSGKTTLLNLMGLLDRPTVGTLSVQGQAAHELGEEERAVLRRDRIGFIFQFHYLLPEFTVIENALMPSRMRGARWERAYAPRMTQLLELVGLGDKLASRPSQLSGGQQQRVAVVRALANEPALVLADEPTGNLDSKSGRIVFDLMRKLARETGTAFVMVTHDDNFALETDRVIRLRDGRILAEPSGDPPLTARV